MGNYNYSDHKRVTEMNGKTIENCYLIKAENSSSLYHYFCIRFTDGTRQILHAHNNAVYDPKPTIEEMRSAPGFFTQEDIMERHAYEEGRLAQRKKNALDRRRREYEKLREEFGDVSIDSG